MGTITMQCFDLKRPKLSLTYHFIAWKLLLIFIALLSPGPGYDTSTSIALDVFFAPSMRESHPTEYASTSQWNLILKLTRWDALYFTKIAQRGYVFEQEWMAGLGFTRLLALLSSFESSLNQMALASVVGVCLAHFSHFFSVLVLYELGILSLGSFQEPKRAAMAFIAAYLHIISPAGIFLSAPYAESLFSLLTFSALYLYARGVSPPVGMRSLQKDVFLMSAGLCFGFATTVRGNGLLNGLVLVYEAACAAFTTLKTKNREQPHAIRRLCVVISAGVLMGCVGFFPQYSAYLEYCVPLARRPWCSRLIPSIYTWIQSEYWGVGFLRYWTISNLPLFALAMPMVGVLSISGIWAWRTTAPSLGLTKQDIRATTSGKNNDREESLESNLNYSNDLPWRLAIPQLVLALLALTTYHVQIITRLSSGYPTWYWWLAHVIIGHGGNVVNSPKYNNLGLVVTRWMVVYAVVQGGLFASFLPPA